MSTPYLRTRCDLRGDVVSPGDLRGFPGRVCWRPGRSLLRRSSSRLGDWSCSRNRSERSHGGPWNDFLFWSVLPADWWAPVTHLRCTAVSETLRATLFIWALVGHL